MNVDFIKLERIRDQVDSLHAGTEMQFAAYRQRLDRAGELRRSAVAGRRDYAHWTIEELLAVSADDAEKAGISLERARAARREMQIAIERKADFDRLCEEKRGIVSLLYRLEQYAGIRN